MVEDRGIADRMKGKANQVAGDLRDDKSQTLKGHAQEARGDAKEKLSRKDDEI